MSEYDIQVNRREQSELPSFICAICQREIVPDRWRPEWHRAPICGHCITHWGSFGATRGITRGDRLSLLRLNAIINGIQWEIHNAKFA